MQIAAFGHLAQESQLKGRLPPDRSEIACGALLSDRGRLRRCCTAGPDDDQKQSNDSRHSFSSEMLPETGIVPRRGEIHETARRAPRGCTPRPLRLKALCWSRFIGQKNPGDVRHSAVSPRFSQTESHSLHRDRQLRMRISTKIAYWRTSQKLVTDELH